MPFRLSPLARAVLTAGAVVLARPAPAQTYTWTGATGNWGSPTSWVEGSVPNTTAHSASLNGAGTLTLEANYSIGGMTFSAGTLAGAGNLTLNGAFDWSQGTIRGPGEVRVNAGGNWPHMTGDGIVLDQKSLVIAGGTVTAWGLSLHNNAAVTVAPGATFKLTGSSVGGWQGGVPNPGTFTNNGTLIFSYAPNLGSTWGAEVPFATTGVIRVQSGGIHFTAGFTQTAGELSMEGGSLSAFAPVQLQGGRLTGAGNISASVIAGNVTIAPSRTIYMADGITLSPETVLELDLGSTFPDKLWTIGGLTLDGTLNVGAGTGFGPGTYVLIDYNGTLTDNGLALGSAPAGYNYQIRIDTVNKDVVLDVTPVPEPAGLTAAVAVVGTWLARRRSRRG